MQTLPGSLALTDAVVTGIDGHHDVLPGNTADCTTPRPTPWASLWITRWRSSLGLAKTCRKLGVPGVGRKDEIGQMADTVAVFKSNMIEANLHGLARRTLDADLRAAMMELLSMKYTR